MIGFKPQQTIYTEDTTEILGTLPRVKIAWGFILHVNFEVPHYGQYEFHEKELSDKWRIKVIIGSTACF